MREEQITIRKTVAADAKNEKDLSKRVPAKRSYFICKFSLEAPPNFKLFLWDLEIAAKHANESSA
ncbi:Uncharacterised protein [Anaerotruncus sp. 2789STDY5834896]|uniref:Uncharacterized protein n=1 Tax=uncultured Anaerotruncus sp. TaxID=905011 RepID=A0A1C6HNI7_9FIRM|nr:Uncharacterised protein [uncultured Anaerotruncus sp.]